MKTNIKDIATQQDTNTHQYTIHQPVHCFSFLFSIVICTFFFLYIVCDFSILCKFIEMLSSWIVHWVLNFDTLFYDLIRSEQDLIRILYFSNNANEQADQIAYSVLCVFSYVAAGQEQKRGLNAHKVFEQPKQQIPTVQTVTSPQAGKLK